MGLLAGARCEAQETINEFDSERIQYSGSILSAVTDCGHARSGGRLDNGTAYEILLIP